MITHETRRESHTKVKKTVGKKHLEVMGILEDMGQATASEIAMQLYLKGLAPYYARNFSHPRLNELVHANRVEVVGKKYDVQTDRNVALYQIIRED